MIGIDEVGRGAWAGPLLVVSVRLKKGKNLPEGLNDSKKLSRHTRETLAAQIRSVCDIGEGWVSADMIDILGLSRAMKSATLLSLLQIDALQEERIIMDGSVNYFKDTAYVNAEIKIKADQTEPLVSAASIVAKTLRDGLMRLYASDFPEYSFETNVGYGTNTHRVALEMLGVTRIHRQSFQPMRAMV